MIAAKKVEDESSSKSSAGGKDSKAKAKVDQMNGWQASDWSILKKLQEQSKNTKNR